MNGYDIQDNRLQTTAHGIWVCVLTQPGVNISNNIISLTRVGIIDKFVTSQQQDAFSSQIESMVSQSRILGYQENFREFSLANQRSLTRLPGTHSSRAPCIQTSASRKMQSAASSQYRQAAAPFHQSPFPSLRRPALFPPAPPPVPSQLV